MSAMNVTDINAHGGLAHCSDSDEGSAMRQEQNREVEHARRSAARQRGFNAAVCGLFMAVPKHEPYPDEWLAGWECGGYLCRM